MDLRRLRYFVILAEELHFGRAADRLAITQPPLSQAIQALEEEVGAALFARTRRSVALTPVGRAWLPHVRRLLDEAAALPGIAHRLSRGELGSLSLAFVSTADYSVLPPLLARHRAAYPEVEVTLREATTDVQIEALLAGEIDAGLVIAGAPPPAALAYRRLLREPLVAAVPAGWAGEGHSRLAAARLAEAPLLIFPRPSAPAFHDLVTGYYAAHGVPLRFGQQAIQMQTLMSLVSAGMGVALVPGSMRNMGRAGVAYCELAGAPMLETGLAWRRDDESPALARFVAMAGRRR